MKDKLGEINNRRKELFNEISEIIDRHPGKTLKISVLFLKFGVKYGTSRVVLGDILDIFAENGLIFIKKDYIEIPPRESSIDHIEKAIDHIENPIEKEIDPNLDNYNNNENGAV